MVYMFAARNRYFSLILSTVHREPTIEFSRLTEMHKLSRKNADLHVLL